MAGLELMGEIPFHTVNIHSTINAPDGRRRMSKSLGTGIDPLEAISTSTAPTRRATGSSRSSPGRPILVRDDRGGPKACDKLRNVSPSILQTATRANADPRPRDLEERSSSHASTQREPSSRARGRGSTSLSRRPRLTNLLDVLRRLLRMYVEAIKPRPYDRDREAIGRRSPRWSAARVAASGDAACMERRSGRAPGFRRQRASDRVSLPDADASFGGDLSALDRVQEAAHIFRRAASRSTSAPTTNGRIFAAVVRPASGRVDGDSDAELSGSGAKIAEPRACSRIERFVRTHRPSSSTPNARSSSAIAASPPLSAAPEAALRRASRRPSCACGARVRDHAGGGDCDGAHRWPRGAEFSAVASSAARQPRGATG